MSNRWASVVEIREHLGVSKDTVYRWIENRGLPAHRIGRLWKFQLSEVDDWVKSGGKNPVDGSRDTHNKKAENEESAYEMARRETK